MSALHIQQVAAELRSARALVAQLPASNALETLYKTLRRVRGALELLALPGATMLARELCETVSQAFGDEARADPLLLDGFEQGLDALADFLTERGDGSRQNPMMFRGFVDQLREARGEEPAAPEAFFDVPVKKLMVELPTSEQVVLDDDLREAARRLRAAYQRGLVEWLRGTDRSSAFQRIDAVVTELEALSKPYPQSTLWWVARAAVACAREDGSALDEVLKPAFSKLDRQIKHLIECGARALGDAPPPALLARLLGGIALSTHESEHVRAVCTAFELRGVERAANAEPAPSATQTDIGPEPVLEEPHREVTAPPDSASPGDSDTGIDATFVEETEELLEALRHALPAMGADGDVPVGVVFTTARASFGELARLAGSIGSSPVAELATAYESLLDGVEAQDVHEVPAVLYQLVCEGRDQVGVLLQRLRSGAGDDGAWRDLVERAQSLLGDAQPLPGAAQALAVDEAPPFLDDSALLMMRSTDVLSRWCDDPANAEYLAELRRGLYALGRDSELGQCQSVSELCHSLDALLAWLESGTHGLSADAYVEPVARAHEMLCLQVSAVRAGRPIPDGSDLAQVLTSLLTATGHHDQAARPPPAGAPEDPPPDTTEPDHIEHVLSLAGALNAARLQVEQHTGLIRENLDALARSVKKLRKRVQSLPVDTAPASVGRSGSLSANLRAAEIDLSRRELESSAEDVDNLHELMAGISDQAQVLLEQQAKLNLDLQRGLLVSRSVSVATLTARFEHLVEATADTFGKRAALEISGGDCEIHRSLYTQLVALVEQLLRNAVEHGVEPGAERGLLGKPMVGTVKLAVEHDAGDLVVRVSDDGSGFDLEAIERRARECGLLGEDAVCDAETLYRLVLQPQVSSAAVARGETRGAGLAEVVTGVERCRGVLTIDHQPGNGASFTLRVPATMAMAEVLLVEAAGERLAIPVNAIESVASMTRQAVEQQMAGEVPMFIQSEKLQHPLAYLGHIFDAQAHPPDPHRQRKAVVVVKSAYRRLAVMVDELRGREVVMLDALSPPLGSIPLVSATTVLGDGRVTLVLDAGTLVRTLSARRGERPGRREARSNAPTVMVVDESYAIRREAGQLLRRNGMQVLTASNGIDALRLLRERCPDVMLVDTSAPGIDGMELSSTVRDDGALGALPIVMLVSGGAPPAGARELGISQWLGKPFREGELLAAIDGVLR